MIDYIANVNEINGYALKNFDYLDADKDGKLSEEDLRQRLKEIPRDNVLGRHAVKAMLARMDEMQTADDEWGFENGISRNDLEDFENDPEQSKLQKKYDKETRGW